MADGPVEKHQLAGFDARERGFSRPVECEQTSEGYRAVLRYETVRVVAEHPVSMEAVLRELVKQLQPQGSRQLRSQLSFKNGTYLGSQQAWVEYTDPEPLMEVPQGLIGRVLRWFRDSERSSP